MTMQPLSSKQILNHMYGVMLEINYLQMDADVMENLTEHHDSFVEEKLLLFKRMSAQYKAKWNRQKFQRALDFLQELKNKGAEEINKILNPQAQVAYAPLFRKFEELTDDDKKSILEDKDLLNLIDYLNEQENNDSFK